MARNYAEAALRHYVDARNLANSGRYDDAGYLIGLAAECALKHAAQGFTVPKNSEIDGYLPQVKRIIRGLLDGRNVRGPLLAIANRREFFEHWHINNRYEANGHIDRVIYEEWMKSAEVALSAAKLRLT
jgi:HEPN domain-containing protein